MPNCEGAGEGWLVGRSGLSHHPLPLAPAAPMRGNPDISTRQSDTIPDLLPGKVQLFADMDSFLFLCSSSTWSA